MKRVLDAGNCGFDHQSIRHFLNEHWIVQIDRASTMDDAMRAISQTDYDLVLVNRIFDSDGDSGLTLVERLATQAGGRRIPTVLLTSFPDVQAQAVQAGAVGSFGKRDLSSGEARQLFSDILGISRAST